MKNATTWIRIAAVLGFLGVALGAMGAHALKDQLAANGATNDNENTDRRNDHPVKQRAARRRTGSCRIWRSG